MDFWSIGIIRGCFCRGLRERKRSTLQKLKLRSFGEPSKKATQRSICTSGWGTVPLRGTTPNKPRYEMHLGFFFY